MRAVFRSSRRPVTRTLLQLMLVEYSIVVGESSRRNADMTRSSFRRISNRPHLRLEGSVYA